MLHASRAETPPTKISRGPYVPLVASLEPLKDSEHQGEVGGAWQDAPRRARGEVARIPSAAGRVAVCAAGGPAGDIHTGRTGSAGRVAGHRAAQAFILLAEEARRAPASSGVVMMRRARAPGSARLFQACGRPPCVRKLRLAQADCAWPQCTGRQCTCSQTLAAARSHPLPRRQKVVQAAAELPAASDSTLHSSPILGAAGEGRPAAESVNVGGSSQRQHRAGPSTFGAAHGRAATPTR